MDTGRKTVDWSQRIVINSVIGVTLPMGRLTRAIRWNGVFFSPNRSPVTNMAPSQTYQHSNRRADDGDKKVRNKHFQASTPL